MPLVLAGLLRILRPRKAGFFEGPVRAGRRSRSWGSSIGPSAGLFDISDPGIVCLVLRGCSLALPGSLDGSGALRRPLRFVRHENPVFLVQFPYVARRSIGAVTPPGASPYSGSSGAPSIGSSATPFRASAVRASLNTNSKPRWP